ncbi:MAG: ATP-dependent Clp protease ATP-binding subunit [Patescibacteria group bacterium]
MYNKFTNRLQKVLERAKWLADFNLRKNVETEDIFVSLSQEKGSMAYEVLSKSGLNKNVSVNTGRVGQKKVANVEFTPQVDSLLKKSVALAAEFEHYYVGTEHLLYILIKNSDKRLEAFLRKNKVNTRNLLENLEIIFQTQNSFPQVSDMLGMENENMLPELLNELGQLGEPGESVSKQFMPKIKDKTGKKYKGSNKKGILQFFAQDLTDPNLQQNIDPVIGRKKEIDRIIQVISRRTKNNPVLLGDPGVGKTAIIEGLGKRILEGNVPDILLDKKIYSLDMNLLLAGSVMRGEFESRLKKVIDEVKKDPNAIIFIDEIHSIVGAGAISGAIDAANILKPALARGEIRCIGATTYEDYKKYIEEDAALERRFQPVIVAEPSIKEAIEMLQGIKVNYEEHHNVQITNSALKAAVELSVRYIPERFLPDKAIDLIDEASARFKVGKGLSEKTKQIRLLEDKLADLINHKIDLVEKEQYPEAVKFKQQEVSLMREIISLKNDQIENIELLGKITDKEIAQVVSEMKNIPVNDLTGQESKKLAKLADELKKYIIGQDEALKQLSFSIKRGRAGLSSIKRPLGSFILLGPSGVGKTETAKVLAKEVFGSEDKLIRMDMSEFAESFNVSRLIGSPPGYVGFKEGGKLTQAVKHKPYSVVLFDEIEKAHPQVLNILLQIMEDGQLTDAIGKTVNFKNTIILMTSNLSLSEINQAEIGFDNTKKQDEFYERLKEKALNSLKDKFNPEFLNRVDNTLVFKPLDMKSIEKIVKLELDRITENLKNKKINIHFDKKLIKHLAEKSFSPEFGARQVRRVVQEEVESILVDKILVGEVKNNTDISLKTSKGKILVKC